MNIDTSLLLMYYLRWLYKISIGALAVGTIAKQCLVYNNGADLLVASCCHKDTYDNLKAFPVVTDRSNLHDG